MCAGEAAKAGPSPPIEARVDARRQLPRNVLNIKAAAPGNASSRRPPRRGRRLSSPRRLSENRRRTASPALSRAECGNARASRSSAVRLSPLSLKILLNLFLVYISWGSTYIGFEFTLEVLGPFLACGSRMFLAGLLLCAAIACTGRWQRPSRADWRHACWLAVFMVLMASGFLGKGQEYISSGVAAVVTGSTPISMLMGAWLFGGEQRPSAMQWLGLAGGLCGLALLGFSQAGSGAEQSSLGGIFWVFGATLGWVTGSLLTRRFPLSTRLSALQSCGLLLLIGGLESLLLGFACGEAAMTRWENLRPEVVLAFAWMTIGGSIIAYSSYFWLLAHVSIATAVSYEYVVPVIGIFLGWWLGGETISGRMILALSLIHI